MSVERSDHLAQLFDPYQQSDEFLKPINARKREIALTETFTLRLTVLLL
jgi:hypothetical protein